MFPCGLSQPEDKMMYSCILEQNCRAQQGNGLLVAGCAFYHMDNNGAVIWPQEMHLHLPSSSLLLFISSQYHKEGTVFCVRLLLLSRAALIVFFPWCRCSSEPNWVSRTISQTRHDIFAVSQQELRCFRVYKEIQRCNIKENAEVQG